MKFESIEQAGAGHPFHIPPVILSTVKFILDYGLETEGIFRLSPEMKVMEEVKRKIAKNPTCDFSSLSSDPHVAAHLLKEFLRSLSLPLIPTSMNKQLMHGAREDEFPSKIATYSSSLHSLPPPSLLSLILLAFVVKEIVSNGEVNKMSYHACGVVFGPCLFRYRVI
jgi:hypothetical protein